VRAIDPYYIEEFLTRPAADVQGRVLEIVDGYGTRTFGSARVTHQRRAVRGEDAARVQCFLYASRVARQQPGSLGPSTNPYRRSVRITT
jgi:hypothetical protein